MSPPLKLHKLGVPAGALPGERALLHDLPETLHVFTWDDLVTHATEHQDRDVARDERHLRRRVPLLVAQKRERAEEGHCARNEAREREEGVLEDDSAKLRRFS